MTIAEDLALIRRQETELVFDQFGEDIACRIGLAIRERALAAGAPIVVDVQYWNRPLFYAALPGSAAANRDWVRRKSNCVRYFGKSSYRVLLENGGNTAIPAREGLEDKDYALSGGSFPITLRNAGIIGAITVSGLPERHDHGLVIDAICEHLGLDAASLALAPQ